MSVRVMTWVFSSAPTETAFEQLVLLAIADHCADDGAGAYPSLETLAKKTRMSVSSVRRAVQSMVSRGLLSLTKRDGFVHQFTIIVTDNPYQSERGSRLRGVSDCSATPSSLEPPPFSDCEGTPLRLRPDPSDNHQINRKRNRQSANPNDAAAPTRELLTQFDQRHQGRFRAKAAINGAKDAKRMADLWRQRQGDPITVEQLIDAFFESQDPFVLQAGFGVGVFVSQIPKLVARVAADVAAAAPAYDWWTECKQLHDLACGHETAHWTVMQRQVKATDPSSSTQHPEARPA